MDETVRRYRNAINGKRSKVAGEWFEKMIDRTLDYYEREGKALIEKTPEPLRPIKSIGQGRFVAVFTKKAQPDYKGTLKGGRAIVFEAKHTDSGRITRDKVLKEQAEQLDKHEKLGASCYVITSFGFERFFLIPWKDFRDMKETFGRKYVTAEDLKGYEIRYEGGILKFL